MEGLGVAASVIAVVELAAKVASLCVDYSCAVKHARADIERLRQRTDSLKATLEGTQRLLERPDGARLATSQKLREALSNTSSRLGKIATRLEEKLNRAKAMRRIGLRALMWPFESKDIDKIVEDLRRDQDTLSAALQVDQTYVLDTPTCLALTSHPAQRFSISTARSTSRGCPSRPARPSTPRPTNTTPSATPVPELTC
jgi:hypothetical protein